MKHKSSIILLYFELHTRKIVEILAICSFCQGVIFWWWEPFIVHFIFFLFLFFHFLAIFCQFENKAANHCNNGLLPTSSTFLCWGLKDNTQIFLQKGQWLGGLARAVLPHFIFYNFFFCFFDSKLFFGKFWMNVIFYCNFDQFRYSRGKFHQKFRYHKYENKNTVNYKSFFLLPCPKAKITHQQNWIQTSEVIWFLVNIQYCGWKIRKLENL